MAGPIIVPLDRSTVSEQALPLARTLAHATRRDVVLVSVIDLPIDFHDWLERSELVGGRISRGRQMLYAYLDDIADTFNGSAVDRKVQTVVKDGSSPGRELLELIEEYDDPLVIMASHGREGLERVITGSVTNQVVLGASCPVLVVRASSITKDQPDHAPVDRILVPLDGSVFAEQALDAAREITSLAQLTVHLVRVVESVDVPEVDYFEPNQYEAYRQASLDEASAYLKEVAGRLEENAVRVSWEVREGPPASNIAAATDEQHADLIVMSTHGRSGVAGLLLGTIAERVLHDASVPLLLVRPAGE